MLRIKNLFLVLFVLLIVRSGGTTETKELASRKRALLETRDILRSILLDISPSMVPVGEYKESHGKSVRPRCDEQYDTRKFECERKKESCSEEYDVVLLQQSQSPSGKMLNEMLAQGTESLNMMGTIKKTLKTVSSEKTRSKYEKTEIEVVPSTGISKSPQQDQARKMDDASKEEEGMNKIEKEELDVIETKDIDLDETASNEENLLSDDSNDVHEEELRDSSENDLSTELTDDLLNDDVVNDDLLNDDVVVDDVDPELEFDGFVDSESLSGTDLNLDLENVDFDKASVELVQSPPPYVDTGDVHEFDFEFGEDYVGLDDSM